MKLRYVINAGVFLAILLAATSSASAETLKLKDGGKIDGIVTKIESGKVYVVVGTETKTVQMGDVERIEFSKPNETETIARTMNDLDKSVEEIRRLLTQVESYWLARQPLDPNEGAGWEAAKETFRQPLAAYQELLNDLHFLVLARVDDYNKLMNEATKVYVGIKGIRIGSNLVAEDMERLPLKKYVPGAWYDTIYTEGYNAGFSDGMSRMYSPPKNNVQ